MSELWCHVEVLQGPGRVVLAAEEARHVVSRRLRVGETLVVFDGRGRVAEARIESMTKRAVELEVAVPREVDRPGSGFVLASAIPKGDRLSTMLQMLSQLGVETWQPLLLEESAVRKLDPEAPRLQRILIESCKVARRPHAMHVLPPTGLGEALAAASGSIWFGDRLAGSQSDASNDSASEPGGVGLAADAGLLLIGPEAGFSDSERASILAAGGRPCAFAPHNLRIETAAIAGAVAYHLATDHVAKGNPA